MFDICTIGDALIDFVPTEDFTSEMPSYHAKVGGTTANLAAASAKLKVNVLFVGKVGQDFLGSLIKREMVKLGVDMSGCVESPDHFTTQSFITLGKNGERSFEFARQHAADIQLKKSELPMEKILKSKIICITGMGLTDEPIREATFHLIQEAERSAIPVALDVNYRDKLWSSKEEMISVVKESLPLISIYKSSEEEAFLLTGELDEKRAAKKISSFGCKVIIISMGEKGSYYYINGKDMYVPPYKVNSIDTTGAGDCFFAAVLYQILQEGDLTSVDFDKLNKYLRFANAVGALATTKRGGVSGAPDLDEVYDFILRN